MIVWYFDECCPYVSEQSSILYYEILKIFVLVDVFFNQNVYSDPIIDESRRFERYWINSETEKIAALSVIMEEE